MIRIGVVGYSGGKFDETIGKALVRIGLDLFEKMHEGEEFSVVSGLTDMGIPAIAYRVADEKGWKTVGIACSKADDNPCYDVDERVIEGDDWGDESETFLNSIDVLLRVGGGKQSLDETERAKGKGLDVFEFDLPEIVD